MNSLQALRQNKVPEITLAFWIVKILATTLGETGGDALSRTLRLGYAVSSAIFIGFFIVAVASQVRAKTFHPFLYWAVIVATTTAGTTMADFADRSLGAGYVGGSLILFALLIAVLALWRFILGSVSVERITSPRVELFYWATILFSNTLGTALGAASRPYGPSYAPYGYGYGYPAPAPVYYPPPAPYYPPARSCWDPYYARYYAC